jgi:hypothetical protein
MDCEKYTHMSKLKEWTQGQMESSESETSVVTLQNPVPVNQILEAVTTSCILSSAQVPPSLIG